MTWAYHATLAGFAFGVGASVGSFLNVCVWRLPRGMSLVRPASRCPRCGAGIAARDNLPVAGWLLLGGRCRRCAGPISPRYPLVEAATGAAFALAAVAAASSDLADRDPALAVACAVYHWALIALLTTAALIAFDRRRTPSPAPVLAPAPPRAAVLDAPALAAALVALTACLAGDPLGAGLNLALLAVFLAHANQPGASGIPPQPPEA